MERELGWDVGEGLQAERTLLGWKGMGLGELHKGGSKWDLGCWRGEQGAHEVVPFRSHDEDFENCTKSKGKY